MKKNGFIASSLLYGMLALFLVIMMSTLGVFASNKLAIDKIKEKAFNNISNQTCIIGKQWQFKYTGAEQIFTVPCKGVYTLEVWGAQGGFAKYGDYTNNGGKGGYSTGQKTLEANTKIYIYVASQGGGATGTATTGTADDKNGYNGGGYGCVTMDNSAGGGGGGATHMANSTGLLKNLSGNKAAIFLVAGGGGGAKSHKSHGTNGDYSGTGGVGGGTNGSNGVIGASAKCYSLGLGATGAAVGGHQTCTNENDGREYNRTANPNTLYANDAAFGLGGNYDSFKLTTTTGGYATDGGGGGGYYGGGAGWHAPGGGGSSYIGGVDAGQTKSGAESMPKHDGSGTMVGNTGNGYAKITLKEILS